VWKKLGSVINLVAAVGIVVVEIAGVEVALRVNQVVDSYLYRLGII
jgi:hypothetical protein